MIPTMQPMLRRTRRLPRLGLLARIAGFATLVGSAPAAGLSHAPTTAPAAPVDLVDPFIGTGGHGHTFPGATLPFGMVQLSPDTRLDGWDGCSGYHFDDTRVFGFSHTHLSGTGVSDYGDVLLLPATGPVKWRSGWHHEDGYGSRFAKETEIASPGFYAVTLADSDIRVELTATERVGIHRYTFPAGTPGHVLVDLTHRDELVDGGLRFIGDDEIEGFRVSKAWAQDQRIYFVARFSRPWTQAEAPQSGGSHPSPVSAAVHFAPDDAPLLVKVGISAVSVENARANLDAEVPHWDFAAVRAAARRTWTDALSRIEVEGGTPAERTAFYTAFYHTLLQPNLFTDVNGEYRGHDGRTHRADGHTQYTVFSLWDTFRAAHPLYTILEPERTVDFVGSMLSQYRQSGLLPVWELAGNETMCMIGYHSASVITDAWVKGIRGFDGDEALAAMVAIATRNHLGLPAYREFGYIPGDRESESVSKTLEYAYDDWCIAQFAGALGDDELRRTFLRRSQSWKNLLDPETGFMRPKSDARWKTPFLPTDVDFHFTEANSWQYSFFVPHDIAGLVTALGGREAFAGRLDALFSAPSTTTGRTQADITGLIGQYAHGNEPSHHMAYLYAFVGQPWKTQARVHEILTTLYAAAPDGLAGNEDCGQMSAWYVLSALGFYSVTPGTDTYVIGTPLFDRATLHLPNGRRLVIVKEEGDDDSCRDGAPSATPLRFIRAASLDGAPFSRTYLRHGEIVAGGELRFTVGDEPDPNWGVGPDGEPFTAVEDPGYVPVPYVASGDATFRDSTTVSLAIPPFASASTAGTGRAATLHYTLDGTDPTPGSPRYEAPFAVDTTTRIRFAAFPPERLLDPPTDAASPAGPFIQEATFRRLDGKVRIVSSTAPSPSYPGGGPDALIDGLRGGPDFRLGVWQGFEGKDLEVIIDLGEERELRRLAVGCLQDENSWIFFPSAAEFATSRDGVEFATVGAAVTMTDARTPGALLTELAAPPPGAPTRYVKVVVHSLGQCPGWHKGAGNPCWIFVDEIIVE